MNRAFLLLVSIIYCYSLKAQTPVLAADVWPGLAGSNPGKLTDFNGKLHFIAQDSAHGFELWSFDQSLTASLVADINPGKPHGAATGNNLMREPMAVLNGKLYYAGVSGSNDPKLFAYDGINPPVTVVTNTYVPAKSSFLSLTAVGNKVYYVSDTAATGLAGRLYSYDPVKGQVLHRKLGVTSLTGNYMPNMLAYNGKLYLCVDSTGIGEELFVHDPATGKTSLVADIAPGTSSGKPGRFAVGGSKLYFAATDQTYGTELYSYDGVVVKRVTDVHPGKNDGVQFASIGNIAYHKGGVYFNGASSMMNSALYRYDTATGSTTMIYDVTPVSIDLITGLTSAGNDLYFCSSTTASGLELWKYDGKTCGMVADLNPGPANGMGGGWANSNFAQVGTSLYFNGNNGVTGSELYRITGLAAGSTGIQHATWNGELIIHPNPAVISATVDIMLREGGRFSLRLTDMAGRQVFSTGLLNLAPGNHNVIIPLEALASGQYFYHLTDYSGRILASSALVRQ